MKIGFLVLSMLVLSIALWAQGDQPDCKQCWVAVDEICNDGSDCVSQEACATKTFTAPCDGNYSFAVKVICDDGYSCLHCYACAFLYDNTAGQPVGSTHFAGGDPRRECQPFAPGGCGPSGETVTLIFDHQYTLTVCLQRCTTTNNCPDCTEHCRAEAHVWHPLAYCPAW